MNAEFYVVDDALFPEDDFSWANPLDPAAIATQIRDGGARWASVNTSIEAFVDAFEILEIHAQAPDYLRDMAFAGSPRLMLTEVPGPWRMGYFEASLASAVLGVIEEKHDEIADETAAKGDEVSDVFNAFHLALQEAHRRHCAVAILYG
jgi:hypothetical protein